MREEKKEEKPVQPTDSAVKIIPEAPKPEKTLEERLERLEKGMTALMQLEMNRNQQPQQQIQGAPNQTAPTQVNGSPEALLKLMEMFGVGGGSSSPQQQTQGWTERFAERYLDMVDKIAERAFKKGLGE